MDRRGRVLLVSSSFAFMSLHGSLVFSTQDRNHACPNFRIGCCNHLPLLTDLFTPSLTGSKACFSSFRSCDLKAET